MSGIVCAVRGGPASQPTIDRAIQLSQETSLLLHFIYIVNLDFLTHTTSSHYHTVLSEMEQMGEFILLSAQARAEAKGITAVGSVRHGNVEMEITQLCQEIQADFLVLGQPKVQAQANVFENEILDKFIARIERQTGAKVVLAEQGQP